MTAPVALPAPVPAVETHLVDPRRDRSLAASIAAARRALTRCGDWPTIGTLAQYQIAVDRAAHEVRLCVAIACPSWPFRTGKNPWRTPISTERRGALRERGARLSEQRKINALGAVTVPPATTLPAEPLRSPEPQKIEASPAAPRFAGRSS